MKAAEIEVKALFDLSHSMAGEFLAKFRYPYEALPELGAWIAAVGPQLSSDEYEKRGEQIWIHKSAKVAPSVSLTGPLIVCANAELRHCAYFRGNVLIGAGSVAGNSCEFKNSLLFDSVEAPHYNYVGDSILGYHAHMGAGSITSNIKSDRKNIVIRTDDGAIETGLRKIGAILGDYVEVGCGTVLNPGSIVGKNTMIYPLTSVRGPVPANTIVKRMDEMTEKQ
ncbi:UDP-N-acetylglucosamine pyrophosphorylase [Stomatobaculum longum]|uniref:UDP-N-acetylglucosamine pyrophosphorylase n=1 Tax=Stomatobaculum longum TaxID=796942 RepID=UPI003C7648F8